MEDLPNFANDAIDAVEGAAAAVAGWAASLKFESKWVKVGVFVGVTLAIVVLLNVIT